jgi:hypothetical protein
MFSRHISRRLAPYLDGRLLSSEVRQADLHLQGCARCRAECEQVRWGMATIAQLPLVEAPAALWSSIEAASRENRSSEEWMFQPLFQRRWAWAFAATIVLALAGAAFWRLEHPAGPRWEVLRLDGSPSVGAQPVDGVGRIGVGQWIETDFRSRAAIKIGEIGSVEVAPNSRLRVVMVRPGENRLALARGEIQARITAPPRLFFVDTASGTAVDLGCEYKLETSEDGSGLLQVTKGWVSFEWHGLESLVPAGARCKTRPRTGPGIPYFDDAPESVKQALEALETFDSDDQRSEALRIILAESRVRDTLTLWHLLARVGIGDRERVFDRIAALTPVPAGVSRDQALKLDPETLKRWKDELAWTW